MTTRAYNIVTPPDDPYLTVYVSDISLGINSRSDGESLLPGGVTQGPNQCSYLENVDISTPGQPKKRYGLLLVGTSGANASGICGLGSYSPGQSTASAGLVKAFSASLEIYKDTGDWVALATGLSASLNYSLAPAGLSGHGDVLLIQNGVDEAYCMYPDGSVSAVGTATDCPPKCLANLYHVTRLFCFGNEADASKDDWLYYSDAYPSAFSGAFDTTTKAFKVNAGEGGAGKAVRAFREDMLALFKEKSIWGLSLSADMSASQLFPVSLSRGLVARNAIDHVGDDLWYLSQDGVRSLKKTENDKLKGFSFPLTHWLKTEWDSISWAYINKACAVWWDNKFFLSLPVDSSTINNEVWVAWPYLTFQIGTETFPAWVVFSGWNVSSWQKRIVNGEELLYAGDESNKNVYQVFGSQGSDNGTAISMKLRTRTLNFNLPFQKKVGGEVLIRALASGNYDVSAFLSTDDSDWQRLGVLNVNGNSPTLPIDLPFNLGGDVIVEDSFHIDNFGEAKRFKVELREDTAQSSDDITLLGINVTAWPVEYEPE